MNFLSPGRAYKWLNQGWALYRKNETFYTNHTIKENDVFLLLKHHCEIRENQGNFDLEEHQFQILFENQIWNLIIMVDVGEDTLLPEFFEIIC